MKTNGFPFAKGSNDRLYFRFIPLERYPDIWIMAGPPTPYQEMAVRDARAGGGVILGVDVSYVFGPVSDAAE